MRIAHVQAVRNEGAELMTNLDYHKGAFCIYLPKFCQEGYCAECEIYLKKRATAKLTDAMGGVREIRKTRETATVSSRP
jgi:hypothetical protein